MSLIFGVGVLITGSIWARGSWGHWWVWSEPTLVSFLIIMLLYATYQPLRFAIEDPERQARYASVFAITAGAFVPMNFLAVRLSTSYLHPRVLGSSSNLPAPMALTFLVSLAAMALLFATLCSYELTAKRTRILLKAPQQDPRLPSERRCASTLAAEHRRRLRGRRLHRVLRDRLIYVAIMAMRLGRVERKRAARLSERAPRHREQHRARLGELHEHGVGDEAPEAGAEQSRYERAAGARHLPQDGARGAARATRVHRGAGDRVRAARRPPPARCARRS